MKFKQINNLTGWAVFLLAFLAYFLSMAPTASFWDCGEFIACANELEVPHPPGAPFFMMVGRVFALFAFNDVTQIAFMLNLMSVLLSAFTVLFTFWITTYLGKRLIEKEGEEFSLGNMVALMGAGVVAAFSCAFATSFWFNSVEAEVYAMSSFFTAIVVWLMFKWEERADEPRNERWIILIAYLMGLSIGVHLLNLLTVPALAFIYYFRKHEFSWPGFILTGIISVGILGMIQTGIILYTFDFAWDFETFFTGTSYPNGTDKGGLGLPFNTGLIVFFLLLFGGLTAILLYSIRTQNKVLNISSLSAIVIYIGFSTYLMIPIRSSTNPPIDQNNPENTRTFLSYMKREQYGDRPLLRGPLYNAQPIGLQEAGSEYIIKDGVDRYVEVGKRQKYKYSNKDMKIFPRMYQPDRYNSGPFGYINYVRKTGDPNTPTDDQPTNAEDLRFFFDYQIGHMYYRYFMWNFAGRESFIQDAGWESGLNFAKTGMMPDVVKNEPSKNHYFMIPLILGLLGLGWQASKKGYDAAIIGLLFFFTGLAIILYLNQYPAQPRERDYSFAGSIQTFAIWIGLGVIALHDLLKRYLGAASGYVAVGIGIIAPLIMLIQNWDDHTRAGRYIAPDSAYNLLNSCAPNAILFTNGDNDTFPLWYLQEVEGVRTDVRVLCLSYVNTDWYIDQMKIKMNESPALPLSLKDEDYTGQAKQMVRAGGRKEIAISLPVNGQELMGKEIIDEDELPYVQSPMAWNVPTRGGGNNRYLELKDKLILNLLENVAKNGWDRPVYFANTVTPSNFLGLQPYLRLEGLAYRVLPVKNPLPNDPYDPYEGSVDTDRMSNNLMTVFKYRNLDNPDVYYDENVFRMLINYHSVFYRLANEYLRQAEEKEKLISLNTLGTEDGDSESAPENDNLKAEAEALKEKAKEVMLFTEKAFPYKVVTPDPFILVRAGIMFDRLEEEEKSKEYFDMAYDIAYNTLKYYADTGDYFRKQNDYMVSLRMMAQHYATSGDTENTQRMQKAMDELRVLTR